MQGPNARERARSRWSRASTSPTRRSRTWRCAKARSAACRRGCSASASPASSASRSTCPADYGRAVWEALCEAGQPLRHHALRHRGHARAARREGLHHRRPGHRRHGDAGRRSASTGRSARPSPTSSASARSPRPDMLAPDRKQLVGLLTDDPDDRAGGGRADRRRPEPADADDACSATSPRPTGAPTLGRSIALALVAGGRDRDRRDAARADAGRHAHRQGRQEHRLLRPRRHAPQRLTESSHERHDCPAHRRRRSPSSPPTTRDLAPPRRPRRRRRRSASSSRPTIGARAVARRRARALCLGPDEWLIEAPLRPTAMPPRRPRRASHAAPLSAVEVSDREITLALEGPAVLDLLATGCPLDLARMPVGSGTRTVFDTAQVVLTREAEDRFHLTVWRSFAAARPRTSRPRRRARLAVRPLGTERRKRPCSTPPHPPLRRRRRRLHRPRARPPAAPDRADRLGEHRLARRADRPGLGPDQQVRRGLSGKRYYGGCEFVDEVETLAIDRVKQLFGAAFANVQPHSGDSPGGSGGRIDPQGPEGKERRGSERVTWVMKGVF